MSFLRHIRMAAALVAVAVFTLGVPALAQEQASASQAQAEKQDPCGHVKYERNKRICQQNVKRSALDMELSRLIIDINYALKTSEAKKTFEYGQDAWSNYMRWSCAFETLGSMHGTEGQIDDQNCRISYMASRVKHLQKYLGCIGTPPCPEKGN